MPGVVQQHVTACIKAIIAIFPFTANYDCVVHQCDSSCHSEFMGKVGHWITLKCFVAKMEQGGLLFALSVSGFSNDIKQHMVF